VTAAVFLAHVLVPLVLAARGTWAVWRFARLPCQAKRHYPAALWAAWRWRWLARNVGLAYVDKHRRRLLRPRLPFTTAVRVEPAPRHLLRWPRARFRADPYGWTVTARIIPKVGREEFDRAAVWLADAWACHRVSVTQDRPGRVRLRALRRDPLAEPLGADVLRPFDGRHVTLGRDEDGQLRPADLANLSGSAYSGNPGRGKTEAALSLAAQLAPSPLVDWWILDGGSCDWAPFADGAAGYVGDDLAAAVDMLTVLDALMGDRRRNLERDRGVRNGWALGPAPDYRLQWVLVEEAPFYLDLDAVKGDKRREDQVRACRGLLAGLLRRGRAPLFHTTLIAQKGTGTAGLPPDLRDLCGIRWSFGVATTEAAVAILGDDIRRHETLSPTLLQGPDHVGVAAALLRTGQSPYTLLRFPAVGQARADQLAADMAARVPAAPVAADTREEVTGDARS
jgi:S-DNA-T family DNA segregation ATPase FtsK/SpoIIIE